MKPFRIKHAAYTWIALGLLIPLLGCVGRPSDSNNPTKPELGTEGDPSSVPQPGT